MMRGGRVQIPPLHGIADVLGLCLMLVILYLLMRWILGGGSPFQELAGWFNPPAMETVLEIEIALAGISGELASLLPVREKGSHSHALELAQQVGEELLRERDKWRLGAVRAARVRELSGTEAWETAWRHAGEAGSESNDGSTSESTIVILLALVSGPALRIPKLVTGDEVARFVRGLGALHVSRLEAFGALASPAAASVQDARELGFVAL